MIYICSQTTEPEIQVFPIFVYLSIQNGNNATGAHGTKVSVIQGFNVSPGNPPCLGPTFSSDKVCWLSLEFSVQHNLANVMC